VGPVPKDAPPLPGADAATRVFSRAAKMSIRLKSAEVIHRIEQNPGYRALQIATTLRGICEWGIWLISQLRWP
jgi:hypothetical protein